MKNLILDISNNNPEPSFAALKREGVVGIWHKVTEGASFRDKYWAGRSKRARAAGLRVGGYHFAKPTNGHGDPEVEAVTFVQALGEIQRRDLRPVLDFEDNSASMGASQLERWARTFSRTFHDKAGIYPLFYSYPYFIKTMNLFQPIGSGLWLASYGKNDGKLYDTYPPYPWKRIAAHQYTSNGHVAGYGPVDMSTADRITSVLAHPVKGLLP